MPIVRQPARFASCPATLPTAPLAAETSTVSRARGSQILSMPYHAVTPGMPTGPRNADIGRRLASTFMIPEPSDKPYCCQPSVPTTVSPGA
jgi:hypothetical protein